LHNKNSGPKARCYINYRIDCKKNRAIVEIAFFLSSTKIIAIIDSAKHSTKFIRKIFLVSLFSGTKKISVFSQNTIMPPNRSGQPQRHKLHDQKN